MATAFRIKEKHGTRESERGRQGSCHAGPSRLLEEFGFYSVCSGKSLKSINRDGSHVTFLKDLLDYVQRENGLDL